MWRGLSGWGPCATCILGSFNALERATAKQHRGAQGRTGGARALSLRDTFEPSKASTRHSSLVVSLSLCRARPTRPRPADPVYLNPPFLSSSRIPFLRLPPPPPSLRSFSASLLAPCKDSSITICPFYPSCPLAPLLLRARDVL